MRSSKHGLWLGALQVGCSLFVACAAGDTEVPRPSSGMGNPSIAFEPSLFDASIANSATTQDGGSSNPDVVVATYSISATVSGLDGNGLVLQNNKGDNLAVTANGKVTFKGKIPDATSYAVSIASQPATPTQTCVVTNGYGSVAGGSVSNIEVGCTTNTYSIQGMISGLAGSGLVLQNDEGDDLSITVNAAFIFATPIASGKPYSVTVKTQPDAPKQLCTVTASEGTVLSDDVTAISVDCVTSP